MIKKIVTGIFCITSPFVFAENINKEITSDTIKENVRTHQIDVSDLDLKTPTAVKHSFDIANPKQFFTVLRFIDMHLEAGVKPENIDVAVVIHGGIVKNLGTDIHDKNLKLLLDSDMVNLYVCGQSLYSKGLNKDFLNPKINMALSAMTAHHYLQKEGYTYNPF